MKSYRVLMPVGYTVNGRGVTCFKIGSVVQIDDEQAKDFVADGRLELVKSAAKSES